MAVAGGGMNHQVAGFVDDDDVVVLIDDLSGIGSAAGLAGSGGGTLTNKIVAGIDVAAGSRIVSPVERDGAGLDQCLQPRARQFGDMAGEHAVEPFTGFVVGDGDCFLRV